MPSNSTNASCESLGEARGFGRKDWLFAVALVAAVFLVYLPCWHGGFLWDDESHLLNNPVLKTGGLAKIWVPGGYLNYWPLTFTAYRLQFELWGLRPLGYHLVNLALHAISALLVWRVLLRLEVPGAMFAAAIFALHPVNVETAAWIAHLKDILSLTFALISMLLYLDSERNASRWRYELAVVVFLLSALAKGTAVTLPVVLLACAWWQRGRIERRDVLRVVPYLLIGAVMAAVEVWTQHNVAGGVIVRSDGILSRAAIAGCAVWFYLGKLILPINLSPIYARWNIDSLNPLWFLPGVLWLALLALAWWRRRSDWGRASVMAIVCYSALLLPILGFANIYFMRYSLVSDHWQYIATIVPCAAFAGITTALARRFVRQPIAITAAIALLVALGVLSIYQSRIYSDSRTSYEATIARNPDCWLAHNNLGMVLSDDGQLDAAIDHFRKALQIKSDYAEAHNNLAAVLLDRGQVDSAIDHLRKALDSNPDYADAHYNLAVVLLGRGQTDSAIEHFEKALEINPAYAGAHYSLGAILAQRGQADAAIDHYGQAIESKPDFAEAHYNLGLLQAARGDVDSAIAHYQRALEIKPNYPEVHYDFAIALTGRGQTDAAVAHYEKAIALKPDYAEAHSNLGNILARRGDLDSAIAHYRRALAIKPDYPEARKNLAIVLSLREKTAKGPD